MHGKQIRYKPIGLIHSPFRSPHGTPIQPKAAKGLRGKVIVWEEYKEGLKDLEGFSHIILIYHFHLIQGYSLLVRPFMDDAYHGVFATRAPKRPNPIGISVVRLIRVKDNTLEVEDIDVVDGTPLLDIKPYVPDFDIREVERYGWLEQVIHKLSRMKDDGRFTQ